MNKLFFGALALSIGAVSSAQFIAKDLVIATQATAGTTGASFTAINKSAGTTGFSTGATTFRFGASSASGGIKVGNDGSFYSPGTLNTSTTSGRIAKVDLSGTATYAVAGSAAPRGVAIKDDNGAFYVVNSAPNLQSGTLNFDGTTANSLSNDGAQSGSPRLVTSHLGVAYSIKAGANVNSYGVFAGNTSSQVASFTSVPTGGLVDLWLSGDGLTMFTAQDGTSASGGINKWTRSSITNSFSLTYTLSTKTGTAVEGARYVTAEETTPGSFTIYAATAETSGNRLVKIVDGGAGSVASALFTAGASDQIRGVAIVPEPASMAVLGLGILGLARRRRTK